MKKRDLQSGTKCRLLTLLLVVCVLSAANTVVGQNTQPQLSGSFMNFSEIAFPREKGETTQIRRHVLYHKCSDQVVQIKKKGRRGMKTKGTNMTDLHAQLIIETTSSGTLIIFGEYTGFQLCFNRRGKLIARQIAANAKKAKLRGKFCEFQEIPSADDFWKFRSAHNTNLYIGFNSKGRPLKGSRLDSSKDDCYKFLKLRGANAQPKRPCVKGNGPLGVHCDQLRKFSRRHRHAASRRVSKRGRRKG